MKIETEHLPSGEWRALDADEYEGECDSNGWWSASLVGYGKTRQEAVDDLLAELEERAKPADDGQPSASVTHPDNEASLDVKDT